MASIRFRSGVGSDFHIFDTTQVIDQISGANHHKYFIQPSVQMAIPAQTAYTINGEANITINTNVRFGISPKIKFLEDFTAGSWRPTSNSELFYIISFTVIFQNLASDSQIYRHAGDYFFRFFVDRDRP